MLSAGDRRKSGLVVYARMAFFQAPPTLGNQFDDDWLLRSYLVRQLPDEVRSAAEPKLQHMGELAGGELYRLQLEDRLNEPRIIHWDAWGNRIDRIELTAVWNRAATIAAEHGVVATAYERTHAEHSRVHQFALAYLFDPSTDTYSCPLAMTDGAAATLSFHKHPIVTERALPRLTSRDPQRMWTSGQWMTERAGGSDVGMSETTARPSEGFYGADHTFRLHGTKWFTSAATSQMALTLGRPLGSPGGGRGLTLFYLETVDPAGRANGIVVNRLKDKLGTRKLPTAELTLDGAIAVAIAGIGNGVRNIAPMLNVTRTWNAVCSTAAMRRGIALALDYATRRRQFGGAISDKPLHVDTLAGLQAEFAGAFSLTFRVVELLGRSESNAASEDDLRLLRILTPVAKLTTAKQSVATLSEVLECFGGAGYVEDTGLPRLLRDAQVFPIWEGTSNVLALDLLRAVGNDFEIGVLAREFERLTTGLEDEALVQAAAQATAAFEHARSWFRSAAQDDPQHLEAGARRFALTIGRSLQLALLCHHGNWCLTQTVRDERPRHAALRLAAHGCDAIRETILCEQSFPLTR